MVTDFSIHVSRPPGRLLSEIGTKGYARFPTALNVNAPKLMWENDFRSLTKTTSPLGQDVKRNP